MENQLSLCLINLSPLTTNHPKILQHLTVQPIAYSWLDHKVSGLILLTFFILIMPTMFIKLANKINLSVHYTKGTLQLKHQLILQ